METKEGRGLREESFEDVLLNNPEKPGLASTVGDILNMASMDASSLAWVTEPADREAIIGLVMQYSSANAAARKDICDKISGIIDRAYDKLNP